jgi:hypothetical protein
MLDRWDLTARVPFELNLTIDTEVQTPKDAAESIVAHYGLST